MPPVPNGPSQPPAANSPAAPLRPPILHRLVIDLPERGGAGFTVNVSEDERRSGLDKQETVRLVRMMDDGVTPDVRVISRQEYEGLYNTAKRKADNKNLKLVPKGPELLNGKEFSWSNGTVRVGPYDGRSNKYLVEAVTKEGDRTVKMVDANILTDLSNPFLDLQRTEQAVKDFQERTFPALNRPIVQEKKTEKANTTKTDGAKETPSSEAKKPPVPEKPAAPLAATVGPSQPAEDDVSPVSSSPEKSPEEEKPLTAVRSETPKTIRQTRANLQTLQQAGTPLPALRQEYQQLITQNSQRILTASPERLASVDMSALGGAIDLLNSEERLRVEQDSLTSLRAAHPEITPTVLQQVVGLLAPQPIAPASAISSSVTATQALNPTPILSQSRSAQTTSSSSGNKQTRSLIEEARGAQQAWVTLQKSLEDQLAGLETEQKNAKEFMALLYNTQQGLRMQDQSAQSQSERRGWDKALGNFSPNRNPAQEISVLEQKMNEAIAKNRERAQRYTALQDALAQSAEAGAVLGQALYQADNEAKISIAETQANLLAALATVQTLIQNVSSLSSPSQVEQKQAQTAQTNRSSDTNKEGVLTRLRRTAFRPLILAAGLNTQQAAAAPTDRLGDARQQMIQADPATNQRNQRAGVKSGSPFFEEATNVDAEAVDNDDENPMRRQAEFMRQKTRDMIETSGQLLGTDESDEESEQEGDEAEFTTRSRSRADEDEEENSDTEETEEQAGQSQDPQTQAKNLLKQEVENRVKKKIKDEALKKASQFFGRSGASAAAGSGAAGATGGAVAGGEAAAVAGGPVVWLIALFVGIFWLNIRLVMPEENSSWRKPLGPWSKMGVVCLDLTVALGIITTVALTVIFILLIAGGPFVIAGGILGQDVGSLIAHTLGL